MNAHGIDILDKAYGDEVVIRVADHLQLQLFPAEDGFLHQHLTHQAGLQAPGAHRLQFLFVVNQSAAGATHGVSGTKNNRVTQLIRDGQCLIHGICHFTAGHLDAQLVHGVLKLDPVLASLDGIHLNADDLHVVFVQNARAGKLCAEI